MHLSQLPLELLWGILAGTDVKTIVKTRQTCEHLRSVVDSSPELQYRIALYRHGMQDAPSKTPLTDTLSERHAKLIQYVFDRDAAQWGSETRLERHCNDLWSHQQGYFVSYSAPARTFTIDRIPSKARGIKAKEWSKHFGFPRRHVMGFTFDPSQHVLLVVTSSGIARDDTPIILYILPFEPSDSDVEPVQHVLSVGGFTFSDGRATPRVLGSTLGIIINASEDNEDILLLVNWKTGEEIHCIYSQVTSFHFLSPTNVMYPYGAWDANQEAYIEGLAVFNVQTKRATFLKLPYAEDSRVDVSVAHGGLVASLDGSFSSSMEDQLLAVSIAVAEDFDSDETLKADSTIFLKASYLLDILVDESKHELGLEYTHPSVLAELEGDDEQPEKRDLPSSYNDIPDSEDGHYTFIGWDTWAGNNNPNILLKLPLACQTSVYGMRALVYAGSDFVGGPASIFDFNPAQMATGEESVPAALYSRDGHTFDTKAMNPSTQQLESQKLPLDVETNHQERERKVVLCDDGIFISESPQWPNRKFNFFTV